MPSMQDVIKNFVLEILHIIKYSDNKEQFVREFEAYNHLEAIANLVERLPEEMKQKVNVVQDDTLVIKQYISPKDYLKELERVSEKELKKFIETISPGLNLDQKQKITKLLQR